MLNETLVEVLTTPPDAAVAIVTQGPDGPHIVNTWHSYVLINDQDQLLIPVGRMVETEKNLAKDSRIQLSVSHRDVQGKKYKGTGFILSGRAAIEKEGANFTLIVKKYFWARAAMVVTIEQLEQTL